MKKNTRKSGMTLIEVTIALAIMGIILVAFLNMFSYAMISVYGTGQKGVSYSKTAADVEKQLAKNETLYTEELLFDFPGVDTIKVPGGLVESVQSHMTKSTKYNVFIPFVPRIELEKAISVEGENISGAFNVTGINTNFDGSTYFEILDKTGTVVYKVIPASEVTTNSSTSLSIASDQVINLINEQSDYIFRVVTPSIDSIDEAARAQYTVQLPMFMVSSADNLFVSADGETWLKRTGLGTMTSSYNFNDLGFGSGVYLASSNTNVYIFENKQGVQIESTLYQINCFYWSNYYKKFFATTNDGRIMSSEDATSWNLHYQVSPIAQMNSVTGIGNEIVAVGNTGRITYSSNGTDFSTVDSNFGYDLMAVSNDNSEIITTYVAVGTNGTILFNNVDPALSDQWSLATGINANVELKSVIYGLDRFVAVGVENTNSVIYTSINGGSWSSVTVNGILLKDIHYSEEENKYYVVGSEKSLLVSSDGLNWISVTVDIFDDELVNITGR